MVKSCGSLGRWFLRRQWHMSVCFDTRTPWLYRNIHQFHHQHRRPFALSAQDASGAELLSLLLLAMASAWLVGCHPLSEAVFHLINTWLAVEDHCGYNLPWALHRMLPFMGGAPYHQDHHVFFRGNYAPYFTHWDRLFGTYYPSVKDLNEQWENTEDKSVHIKDEWWTFLRSYFNQTSALMFPLKSIYSQLSIFLWLIALLSWFPNNYLKELFEKTCWTARWRETGTGAPSKTSLSVMEAHSETGRWRWVGECWTRAWSGVKRLCGQQA